MGPCRNCPPVTSKTTQGNKRPSATKSLQNALSLTAYGPFPQRPLCNREPSYCTAAHRIRVLASSPHALRLGSQGLQSLLESDVLWGAALWQGRKQAAVDYVGPKAASVGQDGFAVLWV
jgi:hypothetical protein